MLIKYFFYNPSLLLKEAGSNVNLIGYYMGISGSGKQSFGNVLERKAYLFGNGSANEIIDENIFLPDSLNTDTIFLSHTS